MLASRRSVRKPHLTCNRLTVVRDTHANITVLVKAETVKPLFLQPEPTEMNNDENIERLRGRNPGEDETNPYEGVDISALPKWWQTAIEEFENAGLRPFQPSRTADGAYKYEVVNELIEQYDVTIEFVGVDVHYGDDWTILIDGDEAASVGHRRSVEGYTVFEISCDELHSLVQTHLEYKSSDSE